MKCQQTPYKFEIEEDLYKYMHNLKVMDSKELYEIHSKKKKKLRSNLSPNLSRKIESKTPDIPKKQYQSSTKTSKKKYRNTIESLATCFQLPEQSNDNLKIEENKKNNSARIISGTSIRKETNEKPEIKKDESNNDGDKTNLSPYKSKEDLVNQEEKNNKIIHTDNNQKTKEENKEDKNIDAHSIKSKKSLNGNTINSNTWRKMSLSRSSLLAGPNPFFMKKILFDYSISKNSVQFNHFSSFVKCHSLSCFWDFYQSFANLPTSPENSFPEQLDSVLNLLFSDSFTEKNVSNFFFMFF